MATEASKSSSHGGDGGGPTDSYLGSLISSNSSDIHYEGVLFSVGNDEASIDLRSDEEESDLVLRAQRTLPRKNRFVVYSSAIESGSESSGASVGSPIDEEESDLEPMRFQRNLPRKGRFVVYSSAIESGSESSGGSVGSPMDSEGNEPPSPCSVLPAVAAINLSASYPATSAPSSSRASFPDSFSTLPATFRDSYSIPRATFPASSSTPPTHFPTSSSTSRATLQETAFATAFFHSILPFKPTLLNPMPLSRLVVEMDENMEKYGLSSEERCNFLAFSPKNVEFLDGLLGDDTFLVLGEHAVYISSGRTEDKKRIP